MTTTSRDISTLRSGGYRFGSAIKASVRTRVLESAERRQRRRDVTRVNGHLASLGAGNDAVSREIRTSIIADFERSA